MTQPNLSQKRFVLNCIRPFKSLVLGQFIISLIWSVDVSLRPYLLKVMLDTVPSLTPGTALSKLALPALLYVSMALIIVLMYRLYDYIWLKLNPPLKRHIAKILMQRMMLHSDKLFQDHFAGGLANKIKDVMSGVPDFCKATMDVFIRHCMALLIALFTVWQVHPIFAQSLMIWIIIFVGGSIFFSKKAKKLSHHSAEVKSEVMGALVDILSNMSSVRLFARARDEIKKLSPTLDAYVNADQKRDWYFLKMFTFQGLSFVIYQGVCLFWLVRGLDAGHITAGDFALILTINISIVDFLWSLAIDIGKYADLLGSISQGLSIALSPLDIEDHPKAHPLEVKQGAIVFDKVHFGYSKDNPLFQDLSLTIQAGEKVGLVGYSGGGKTTFVNLILRLFEIQQGQIFIDHQDIKTVTQQSLRQAIGMIPQDPTLFHRSLYDNIGYGDMKASTHDIIRAAKKAHADAFIASLPEGYASHVGERGVKLSGGQRQRIAIARAILKNAPILILDEATSQLDSVTEQLIQESLWDLIQEKTTLVIAHRLSTLLHMDRILVFDRGVIVEDGSHDNLIQKNGLYKTLFETQVGGFLKDSAIE
ncbi:MAG: ABC transporter ATP-binding protein [Candidatus Nucleicultricaceae bacterium]